jgi:hypothetical protein
MLKRPLPLLVFVAESGNDEELAVDLVGPSDGQSVSQSVRPSVRQSVSQSVILTSGFHIRKCIEGAWFGNPANVDAAGLVLTHDASSGVLLRSTAVRFVKERRTLFVCV